MIRIHSTTTRKHKDISDDDVAALTPEAALELVQGVAEHDAVEPRPVKKLPTG
ncbi:MAG TPA: hypothetical protein VHW02_07960 [Rhizomicrobium sp.]|jgi:hypothetical protein|nr:hypothetical protein [Rhizomicrobium sp.]